MNSCKGFLYGRLDPPNAGLGKEDNFLARPRARDAPRDRRPLVWSTFRCRRNHAELDRWFVGGLASSAGVKDEEEAGRERQNTLSGEVGSRPLQFEIILGIDGAVGVVMRQIGPDRPEATIETGGVSYNGDGWVY